MLLASFTGCALCRHVITGCIVTGVPFFCPVLKGVKVNPGDWIYADWDGILVSKKDLA